MINNLPIKKITSSRFKKIVHRRKILALMHENGQLSAPIPANCVKSSLPNYHASLNNLFPDANVKNFGVGESSGGRIPSLFSLHEDPFDVLPCDFSRFSINVTTMNPCHKFINPIIHTHSDHPSLLDRFYNTAQQHFEEHSISMEKRC
jgi:N-acetylglucosamine repressor